MGTKLRALYQRKKGRDLLDLALALENEKVDAGRIVNAFVQYMSHGGLRVTRAQFEENIDAKLRDPQFTADIGLLLASDFSWDINIAADMVKATLIERLTGRPWQGLK